MKKSTSYFLGFLLLIFALSALTFLTSCNGGARYVMTVKGMEVYYKQQQNEDPAPWADTKLALEMLHCALQAEWGEEWADAMMKTRVIIYGTQIESGNLDTSRFSGLYEPATHHIKLVLRGPTAMDSALYHEMYQHRLAYFKTSSWRHQCVEDCKVACLKRGILKKSCSIVCSTECPNATFNPGHSEPFWYEKHRFSMLYQCKQMITRTSSTPNGLQTP